MSDEKPTAKECPRCLETMDIATCYYRTSKYSYCKYCKPCHVARRCLWVQNSKPYVKRPTGFQKISLSVQEDIVDSIKNGLSLKQISDKHSIVYGTILRWKRLKKMYIKK